MAAKSTLHVGNGTVGVACTLLCLRCPCLELLDGAEKCIHGGALLADLCPTRKNTIKTPQQIPGESHHTVLLYTML